MKNTTLRNFFSKNLKPVANENVYIPNNGVNDVDRMSYFTNYDRDRYLKILQLKAQQ